jgi:organic hydroperoxide reductase OsmC/OhrA
MASCRADLQMQLWHNYYCAYPTSSASVLQARVPDQLRHLEVAACHQNWYAVAAVQYWLNTSDAGFDIRHKPVKGAEVALHSNLSVLPGSKVLQEGLEVLPACIIAA